MSEDGTYKVKQYPLRGINLKEINTHKMKVCTCGHFWHDHNYKSNCTTCLCPIFEFYMEMTFDEQERLTKSRVGDIST